MIKVLMISAISLMISTSVYARMYKCEVDGKVTYSQTKCEGNAENFKSYDADKFHKDAIMKRKLDEYEYAKNAPLRELEERYLRHRTEIERELKTINLGTNQTFGELVANRRRKAALEHELKRLEMDYMNVIDPEGATERAMLNKLDDISDSLKKVRKRQNRSTTTTYDAQTGRTKTCTTIGNFENCY